MKSALRARKTKIRKSLQLIVDNFNEIDSALNIGQKREKDIKIFLDENGNYVLYSPLKGHEEITAVYRAKDKNIYRITIALNPLEYGVILKGK